MDWKYWREHFEANRGRPLPDLRGIREELPEPWRVPLVRSLAIFQLGETGEGSIVGQVRRARLPGTDGDYAEAVAGFVREEGRHAAILARMVSGLGGELIRTDFTRSGFVWLRRSVGLRFKLVVGLAAEIVGIGFYGPLAEALPPGNLSAAFGELCADEAHHLAFHRDFFRSQLKGPLGRLAFRAGLWSVSAGAGALMLWTHRRTLDALGIGGARPARRMFELTRTASLCSVSDS